MRTTLLLTFVFLLVGCETTYRSYYILEYNVDSDAEQALLQKLDKLAAEFGLERSIGLESGVIGYGRGTLSEVPKEFKRVKGSRISLLISYNKGENSLYLTSLSSSKETDFIRLVRTQIEKIIEDLDGVQIDSFNETGYKHSILGP